MIIYAFELCSQAYKYTFHVKKKCTFCYCQLKLEGIREKQQFYENDIFTQFIFISQHCHIVIIIIIESHYNY